MVSQISLVMESFSDGWDIGLERWKIPRILHGMATLAWDAHDGQGHVLFPDVNTLDSI